jgi:hypothetical protein
MSDQNNRKKSGNHPKGALSQLKRRVDPPTVQVSPDAFDGKMPMRHRAYFKVIGISKEEKLVELRKKETIIGRATECDIELPSNNVSRKHACIEFRNEEYHLRDLDSTNGVYVNGIKIVKCVLRNLDQIEIGGIKLLFNEEHTLEHT